MDFDKAIQAHVQWKSKLAAYLAKPDHSLIPAIVGDSAKCDLGKWLRGEGQKHAKHGEFVKLVAEHDRFHAAAAKIVQRADSGEKVGEAIALGSKSDYAHASNATVTAIMKMKKVA